MNAEMTILFEQTVQKDRNNRVDIVLKEWRAGTMDKHIDMVVTLKVWQDMSLEFGDPVKTTIVLDTTLRHEAIRQAIAMFDQARKDYQ